mgnify:CR=1 FL=1
MQYDDSQQAMLQLIGSSGPQIRSLTPPRPVPPSLNKGNLYSNLRAETAPQQSVSTRDVELFDDESTYQSHAPASCTKGSVVDCSYSKAMMQKWVPPVYYSSKHKSAVPEVGSIPSKFKRGGASPAAGRPHSLSDDMMPSQRASPNSRLYATTHSTATTSANELNPPNNSSSAEGYGEGYGEVVRRRTFVGGVNAGERPRSRQDSIGAVRLPVGEHAQRAVASRESQQILLSVQDT